DDLIAATRKGKNVMNLDAKTEARFAPRIEGDMVAIAGENRKLLVFPLAQIAEMSRGRGVRLQKYKDGTVADAKTFESAKGLTWLDTSGRTWTLAGEELRDWTGNRADAGRLAPKGFPRSNKFKPD